MRGGRLALLLLAFAPGAPAGPETVEALLSSTLPAKREEAAAALGQKGDTAAAKKLIGLLDDPDWGVQMAAIRALGPIRFEPGRDALRKKALGGPIRAVRVLAATQLREHDAGPAAARLAANLTRLKKEARLPAIEALGILGTADAVEALAEQLRAPEPEHRVAAARALGRLRAGEKALVRALKDKEAAVSLLAAVALAGVDSDTARAEILDHAAGLDPLEGYVLRRVGRRGAEANRDAFAKALDARVAKAKQPAALLAVAVAGAVPVPSALAHFDHNDPLARAFAFRAAALGPDRVAVADAGKGLDDKDRRVRFAGRCPTTRGLCPPWRRP